MTSLRTAPSSPTSGSVSSSPATRPDRKLERLLQELVALRHPATTEVVVTDLTVQPELFSELEVLATPVIIRESPGPARRLVGSGADLEQIIEQLELTVPAGARTPTVFSPLRVAPAPGDPLVRTG